MPWWSLSTVFQHTRLKAKLVSCPDPTQLAFQMAAVTMCTTVVLPWQQLHPIRSICKMHIIWCVQSRARPQMHEHAHMHDTKQNALKCFFSFVCWKKWLIKTKTKIIWFVEHNTSVFLRFLDLDIHWLQTGSSRPQPQAALYWFNISLGNYIFRLFG